MSRMSWRTWSALALVALCAFLSVSNLVPEESRRESPLLPDEGLRLGLDLQGGIHWVLGVQLDVAARQELEFLRENLSEVAEDEDALSVESASVDDQRLTVRAAGSSAAT